MRHDHPYFIKNHDNTVNHPTGFTMWSGWGSIAHHSGPMFRDILINAADHPEKNIVLSSCSDDIYTVPEQIREYAKQNDIAVIVPVLCSFGKLKPRECMYIPPSDEYYVQNMYDIFAPHHVPWEQKINKVVWRGGLSGETLRIDAVKFCLNVPHTDVKLIDNWPRPEYNPKDTPELFAERIDAFNQCKYKAVFWIDGNCIPSNVLWVFASGSVPVIINETYFWFKEHLVPWKNYVPVSADFSDLEKNVKWIFENDEEARKIAQNALELARTVLSSKGQKEYIRKAIDNHIKEAKKPAPVYPKPVEILFPLLTFGGMASTERYVRRRASLILDTLMEYYETKKSDDLEKIFKSVNEINVSNFPEVSELLKKAFEVLEKELPETKSYIDKYTDTILLK